MQKIYFVLIFSFIVFQFNLHAQPELEHDRSGCHFHKKQIHSDLLKLYPDADVMAGFNDRSDTIDILHYDIYLEPNPTQKKIYGTCEVKFRPLMANIDSITLDLEGLVVDSVWNEHGALAFDYNERHLKVAMGAMMEMSDTFEVFVKYHGTPITSSSNFGGFYFDEGYMYNLSIGITDFPHNYGRAWFPCFDNFKERSTYTFQLVTNKIHKAYASGKFIRMDSLNETQNLWVYENDIQLPTYLASVAIADYKTINWDHQGLFGNIPVRISAKSNHIAEAQNDFMALDDAIECFENWYGPMPWHGVGYSMATRGAMENPNNVIYPDFNLENPEQDHRRLMSHELCHYWWGNIVNPKTASDMWIKEGNAEYGAQLFYEYTEGEQYFEDALSSKFLDVITNAHLDDDGYQPLSPMPQYTTYGTHTYHKGACMLHNMRAYLGDSLFRVGQQACLNDFYLGPMDAYEYRDKLTESTGYDMTDYFDDFVFSPGFINFEIDSFFIETAGADYAVTVFVEQKLHRRTKYADNIPVYITFLDVNHNQLTLSQEASGKNSQLKFTLPFSPIYAFLNMHQNMNIAQFSDEQWIAEVKNYGFSHTGTRIDMNSPADSSYVRVTHHWTGPDSINSPTAIISKNHYWKLEGELDGRLDAFVLWGYDGNEGKLDEDLTSNTEDSLILVYRPDYRSPWKEYDDYRKIVLSKTDKKGFVRLQSVALGEYAFANGALDAVPAKDIHVEKTDLFCYPNPTEGLVFIDMVGLHGAAQLQLMDVSGKLVWQKDLRDFNGRYQESIDFSSLVKGTYTLTFRQGENVNTERVIRL